MDRSNEMKRIFSVAICVVFTVLCLAGCGNNNRKLFAGVNLEKYVRLGDYKGINVDTSSSDFTKVYDEIKSADIQNGGFYVKKTEGAVENGDTVNIDYTGKKDGVAFDGGTAQGYDLKIGSNSFIEGFESGLIGVQIGSTVDLDLKFPESYSSKELAGQPVVFTVKVNYVTTEAEQTPAEYYGELGFKTLKDYENDLKKRAVKQFIYEKITDSSTVKDYPADDTETVYNTYYNLVNAQVSSYGMTIEQLISAQGISEDDFKNKMLKETVYPEMNRQLIYYAILDNEKMKVTNEEISDQFNEFKKGMTASSALSDEQLNEYFGEYYFEVLAVEEKIGDFLYDNAVIK